MSVWNQGFLQGDEADRWRLSVRTEKVPTTGKQHKHLYFSVYWGLLRLSFQSNRIQWSRVPFMNTLLILLLGSSCHNFSHLCILSEHYCDGMLGWRGDYIVIDNEIQMFN